MNAICWIISTSVSAEGRWPEAGRAWRFLYLVRKALSEARLSSPVMPSFLVRSKWAVMIALSAVDALAARARRAAMRAMPLPAASSMSSSESSEALFPNMNSRRVRS